MPDIATIAILVIAIATVVLSVYTVKTQLDLKAAIRAVNDGHAALNECQLDLLHKVKYLDDFSYQNSSRLVGAENQLRSLKRLSDLEDFTYLAAHMKDESDRYAALSRDYQAKAKVLKKGVQS